MIKNLILFQLLFFLIKTQLFVNETQLISNDGELNDNFGKSVSITQNYAVIGSPNSQVGNNPEQGKAYIFQKNGSNWVQYLTLTASDGNSGDNFGFSVQISQDENYIIVGAYSANLWNTSNQGKAYIFQNNGTNWIEKQILTASDGNSNDNFGYSVGISQDVNYIIISSPYANVSNNTYQGKAYIFQNNGTNWIQQEILTASDGNAGSNFGYSLSISGNYTIIGAPYANVGANLSQGKSYIFQNNGTNWIEKQILTASDGSYSDYFGYSVGISQDDSIIIGAPGVVYTNSSNKGKAYLFEMNGSNWIQNQILIPNDSNFASFGVSSAIFGNLSIVGSYGYQKLSEGSNGKGYVFEKMDSVWTQQLSLFPSDGTNGDYFGKSVNLYNSSFIVGASHANVNNNSLQGKSYVFTNSSSIPQVNIQSCVSLFSQFACYWNQIIGSNVDYQIYYDQQWISIQNPLLNNSIYSQLFNSSQYPNISGNVDYSIQIRACDSFMNVCGDASNPWNLTTRIDSVKNLSLSALLNSQISVSWDYPDVPLVNSTPKLDHYIISYQSNSSNQTQLSFPNSSKSAILTSNLLSNTNYSVSIWGCSNEECLNQNQGEIVSNSIFTLFGKVYNLSCSISNSINIECNWNQPSGSRIPTNYTFSYSSNDSNDSNSIQVTTTSYNFTALIPNEEYTINVSACDSNLNCGDISTINIKTKLTKPNILYWNGGIQEFQINFSKIERNYGYLISIDNGNTWNHFDQINESGENVYGVKDNIPGNVLYNVLISGCSESTCNISLLGPSSSSVSMIAKLGNIESLSCSAIDTSIKCNWNGLLLSEGLKGYCFSCNSTTEFLNSNQTEFTQNNLKEGEVYLISVFASALDNCSVSNYSGSPSTSLVQIFPPNPSTSTSSSSKAGVIAAAVIVPIVVIAIVIIAIVLIRKKKSHHKEIHQDMNLAQERLISSDQENLD
ncbi:hypothetical protein M0811_14562 [Anaeramoeba ignava]|uniref:Fibronectin type-III domain-containing protein n=1 Tax=Anaeramoeba ignava TaxID=1746090 RepID=A0A9Q0LXD6_ANAIG|nr:hypothetical protein M0811_14562 [Anaeramoeba ignava]